MRCLALAAIVSICASAVFGQEKQRPGAAADEITLMAQTEMKDGGTIKLRGHVQIISAGVTVFADEADYDPLTGDLQARGHVHIVFKRTTPIVKIQHPNPEDMPAR